MHSFRTPSLSTKDSGVTYCNQCDNIRAMYRCVITGTNSHSTSSGRIVVHFILRIVKVSYSHLCPVYQVFAQVMNARPQGGEEGGRVSFIPTRGTLTDTLWCNSDSLYKGEHWRKVDAFVVQ